MVYATHRCKYAESPHSYKLARRLSGNFTGRLFEAEDVETSTSCKHGPGRNPVQIAIRKAEENGVRLVDVRNSDYFGATGIYTVLAARRGQMGMGMNWWRDIRLGVDLWQRPNVWNQHSRPFRPWA